LIHFYKRPMYENELTRGNNVHLEAADEGRGGANS